MSPDIASKIEQLWRRFQDRESRHNWASSHLSTNLAAQIFSLREARGWTQTELAEAAGMAQSRISLLEDPSYEKFSLTTLKRLATAFDVVFVGRFVTFSEMLAWSTNLTPERLAPREFVKDRPPAAVAEERPLVREANPNVMLGEAQALRRTQIQGGPLDAGQSVTALGPGDAIVVKAAMGKLLGQPQRNEPIRESALNGRQPARREREQALFMS